MTQDMAVEGRRGIVASKLRAIWASLTIIFGLAIIIILMPFQKDNGRHARRFCRFFFPLNRFRLERIGEYDLSAGLIVINHQSCADIISIEGDHPSNICWVCKKELAKMFFYGRTVKVPKMILVDREDRHGIIELLKDARDRIGKNRPVVIFPEGTRGKGDRELLDFKPGAKILAEKLKLKVQPIVIINARQVYGTSPLQSEKNTIRIVTMDSVTPHGDDWYNKMREDMLSVYRKHYDEMNEITQDTQDR